MTEQDHPPIDPNPNDNEDHAAVSLEESKQAWLDYLRGMELLDEETKSHLPELYTGEEQGLDALAQVKFFTPDSNWTWYGSEYDGEDVFFGLVSGLEIELGYFSLSELRSVQGPMGLPIERDLYFEPKSLRELKQWHEEQRRGQI